MLGFKKSSKFTCLKMSTVQEDSGGGKLGKMNPIHQYFTQIHLSS